MINNQFSKPAAQIPDQNVLRCCDLGPGGRTPRLALVTNLDGNELNGMFVLTRLAAFLQSIESGEQDGLRLRERVVIIPAMPDAHSAIATIPRQKQLGVVARRRSLDGAMADTVAALIRAAYYRVDLHSSAPAIEEMPQVRLYAPSDDERASACLFGLPAVIERPAIDDAASGLVRAWRAHGGENFVIHAGQAGRLQTGHCETLFRALAAFLDRTGTVSGLRPVDDDEDLRYFGLQQVVTVVAEQSGLLASRLEVGRWIQAGEVLGLIYDSFTGGIQKQVLAPVAGLLASLRRQPFLRRGDLVARILTPAVAVQRRPARLGERHGRWFSRRA